MRVRWVVGAAGLLLLLPGLFMRTEVRGQEDGASPAPDAYVGPEECAICHPSVYDAWRSSTHATTLQEAPVLLA